MALPQSVRIWREQTTLGVSLGTWTLFSLSFSLWIGYAVRVHNELNFVCNLGTLASAAILMTGFARYSLLTLRARIPSFSRRAGGERRAKGLSALRPRRSRSTFRIR